MQVVMQVLTMHECVLCALMVDAEMMFVFETILDKFQVFDEPFFVGVILSISS